MAKKKEPRPAKCKHDGGEYVEAYFSACPNPVIVLHCIGCDATRVILGDMPNHDNYDDD